MNQDIRIAVNFVDHPKTFKLRRRLGADAVLCLVRLWSYAAVNKPNGKFDGMDAEDIEIAAKWEGEHGALVRTLADVKFLVESNGQYSLHDWEDHNPYAFYAPSRRQKARNAAAARHAKTDGEQCSMPLGATSEHCSTGDRAMLNGASSIAPYPDPSPSPSPVPPTGAHVRPSDPPVITLTLNTGEEFPIFKRQCAEWETLFPAVDVPQELRNMRAWLLANARNRKTRAGALKFVTSWLSRAQDRAPKAGGLREAHRPTDNSAPARVQRAAEQRRQQQRPPIDIKPERSD